MMSSYRGLLACWLFLVLASGCGRAARTEPVARLEGAVTVGGKPLPADAEGVVVFEPAVRGQTPPVQAAVKEGRYRAEKVPVGQVLATFHVTRRTGKMLKSSPSDAHPTPERLDLVPAASRNGVKLDVKGDNSHQDFDLR